MAYCCERDGTGNPFLWLCGAKATRKIGKAQPDLSQITASILQGRSGEGLAQKEKTPKMDAI